MEGGADVRSIESIREFRAALVVFIEEARAAIASADAEVSRAHTWVERERLPYWKQQAQRRGEEVTRAKSALARARDGTSYHRKSCVDEEKALDRAERRLESAKRHHEACRRWLVRLEKEALLYRGRMQRLSGLLEGDLAGAVHVLEQTAQRLERYVSLQAPSGEEGAPSRAPGADEGGEGTDDEGGET